MSTILRWKASFTCQKINVANKRVRIMMKKFSVYPQLGYIHSNFEHVMNLIKLGNVLREENTPHTVLSLAVSSNLFKLRFSKILNYTALRLV